MDFELYLWHANDVRTWLYTTGVMLTLDNCRKQVDVPLWHITVQADRYFDHRVVEQHLRVVFSDVHVAQSDALSHAPTIIADKSIAAPMVPTKLRRALNRR